MRLYYPHRDDARAARHALNLAYAGILSTSGHERDCLEAVDAAYAAGLPVTQEQICRAHDAIHRMNGNR